MPLVQTLVAMASPGAMRLDSPASSMARGLFLFLGALAFAAVSPWGSGHGDATDRLLRLHLLAASAFLVLLAPFVAVRHTLLVLPYFLLLLARSPRWPSGRSLRVALALSTAVGALVAIADIRIAAVYRDAVARWAPELHRRNPAAHTWFLGHWGFQWYATRAGMQPYFPGRSTLTDGDWLVVPEGVHQQALAEADRARLREVEVERIAAGPLDVFRTLHHGGGFYASYAVPPYAPSTDPLETFRIYVYDGGRR